MVSLLALLGPLGPAEAWSADDSVPGQFIVVVQPGADPPQVAQDHATVPVHVYTVAARGFAARLSPGQVAALLADPRVNNVVPDRQFRVLPKPDKPGKPTPTPTPEPIQTTPTGVDRIDAEGAVRGDFPVAVAIIDTSITLHSDLNLVESVNFAESL
ncbi:MAG: protease inhibitor I9 family protein [Chloroflexota bacterium]|nr:protease inhibitor I9 family protein [Chloroflexota bacterium]